MNDSEFDIFMKDMVEKLVAFFNENAPRSPATFLHNMKSDLGKAIDTNIDKVKAQFPTFLSSMVFPSREEILGRWLNDPRQLELSKLIDAAETKVKWAFLEHLWGHVASEETFAHMVGVIEARQHAAELKGEAKARVAIQVCGTTAELLYKPFLEGVRALYLCANGMPLTPAPSLGALINELEQNMPASALVDPNAGWMRNSAMHGRWRYLPDRDALEMWDLKRPAEVHKTEDLLGRVGDWYNMSIKIMQRLYQCNAAKHWKEILAVVNAGFPSP